MPDRPRKRKARTGGAARPGPVPSKVLDAVFGALAHPARRQILASLHGRGGEMTAGEIADRFACSWPTTTRHLTVLKDAGLLAVGKDGRYRIYRLHASEAIRAAGWILSWGVPATERQGKERPDWVNLPFASMRNATPPGSEPA